MKRQINLMTPGEKILLKCLSIDHKSHTMWCNMQLQLYGQKTGPNYTTSGFNNIHLKCAQQNCMDTPLILRCPLTLEPIQNAGKHGYQDFQHHWLIRDRSLKRISNTLCATTARTCRKDCLYCSLLQPREANRIIIHSAHLTVTFMVNIWVSFLNYTIQFLTVCTYTYNDNKTMCQLLRLQQMQSTRQTHNSSVKQPNSAVPCVQHTHTHTHTHTLTSGSLSCGTQTASVSMPITSSSLWTLTSVSTLMLSIFCFKIVNTN